LRDEEGADQRERQAKQLFESFCRREQQREGGETNAFARLLRDTIDADRYPLSPRVQMWKGILAKIRPEPKPEPLPPIKHYEPPGRGRYGRRG
jgi:hypothetical protein